MGALLSNLPHLDVAKTASPDPNYGQATVTLTVTGDGEPAGQRLPVDVMLILDRSGSMDSGGKIAAAKAAAKAFVGLLDPNLDHVGLVSYSDSASLNQGLTTNFNTVKTLIDGLSTSGYTNIGAGINTANTEFTNHGRPGVVRVEILLTDGLPNRPNGHGSDFNEPDAEYARGSALAARTAGITLYTIGLGTSLDHSNGISYYFLDDLPASGHNYRPGDPAGNNYAHGGLAFIGGGHFYAAPTAGELQSIFEQISGKVTNIAGTNVTVTEVLPSGVHYVPLSGVPTPASIAGQTLTWVEGSVSINDTKTITFNVTFDNSGYQLVDVYPGTHVDYTNYLGNPASAVFPETHVTVGRFPVANNQSLSVDSCNTLTATLSGTDADGDPLTYKVSGLPSHGNLYDGTGTGGTHITAVPYTVTNLAHNVTYQPTSTYSGADSFGFKVNDGNIDSAEGTVSITVSDGRSTYYRDSDADGYGNATVSQQACTKPSGYVADSSDCNDSNAASIRGPLRRATA